MSARAGALVVHPGALGDVLLAAPALVHLRALGLPPALGVASHLVGLWRCSGLVERAMDLETLGLHRAFTAGGDDGLALTSLAGYRAVVSWFGAGDASYRTSLGRLGCPVVIARTTPLPESRAHMSRHLLDTLAPLGPVPDALPEARLAAGAEHRAEAARWLAAHGVRPAEAVVLQPGAGSSAKVWPGFEALARRLREDGTPTVVLAGSADARVLASLSGTGALDGILVARDWPLARVAALLTLARATIGNDSGPTHLAAAVGCPTVALFGPTDPVRWAPPGRHVRVLAGGGRGDPWTGVTVGRTLAALRDLAVPGVPSTTVGAPA